MFKCPKRDPIMKLKKNKLNLWRTPINNSIGNNAEIELEKQWIEPQFGEGVHSEFNSRAGVLNDSALIANTLLISIQLNILKMILSNGIEKGAD